jgi:hypothetical protein
MRELLWGCDEHLGLTPTSRLSADTREGGASRDVVSTEDGAHRSRPHARRSWPLAMRMSPQAETSAQMPSSSKNPY